MATQPEPGWYDDGTGRQRWWDGTRWGDQYIDLREPDPELRTDAGPVAAAAAQAGWYDDRRGRTRWWDGRRWTGNVRYSGQEQDFGGIVIDGRWVHFGELSVAVSEVAASVESGDVLLRSPAFTKAAAERRLIGHAGLITPRVLNRAIHRAALYLVVRGVQVWAVPVAAGREDHARRFASWVNTSAEHYRHR